MWTVDSWQLVAVVAGEGCVSPYLSYLSPTSPVGGGGTPPPLPRPCNRCMSLSVFSVWGPGDIGPTSVLGFT